MLYSKFLKISLLLLLGSCSSEIPQQKDVIDNYYLCGDLKKQDYINNLESYLILHFNSENEVTITKKYEDSIQPYERIDSTSFNILAEENIVFTLNKENQILENEIDSLTCKMIFDNELDLVQDEIERVNNSPSSYPELDRILGDLIILPQDDYDIDEANRMIKRISNIPVLMLEGLINQGVKIYLTNTNITEVQEYQYLQGVVPRGWEETGLTWDDVPGIGGNPVVARIGYSEPGNSHNSINLELHEIAHAIDYYVFNDISYSYEFQKVWKQEVSQLVTLIGNADYLGTNAEEYFAEVFAYYYLSEETRHIIRDNAPNTFDFMENHWKRH